MFGIIEIAKYIPNGHISNYDFIEKFEIDEDFIEDKIGIKAVSRKSNDESVTSMCVEAYNELQKKISIDKDTIDCVIVITQNPDYNIPHNSAIVHGALELPNSCAAFDVSLGCSGFVYGLSVITAFLSQNKLNNGLLFTADPYSKILNPEDKNTSLLFGDAATVSLIGKNPKLTPGKFTFGTIGKDYKNLICENDILYMNGRGIFNFAAKNIPKDLKLLLEESNLEIKDIDQFVFHQGSKYIVDTIAKRLGVESDKVPFTIANYGNTVSSSIPIILEESISNDSLKNIAISGFGVGLSWASCILKK